MNVQIFFNRLELDRLKNVFSAGSLFVLFLLAFPIGCHSVKLPVVIKDDASLEEIQKAVNANSAKIETLRSQNALIGISNSPGSANCQLAFERKRRCVRLIGNSPLAGGRVVDCGCNENLFWFWTSLVKPSQISYCRLDEFSNDKSLTAALPFDPTWFPEILGVVEFNNDEEAEGPIAQTDGTLLITTKKNRPNGTYTKRIYVEPKTAAIKRQDIQDPNGNVVVSVVCNKFQFDETQQVVLPQILILKFAQSDEAFHFNLGTLEVNSAEAFPTDIFEMPPSVDLQNSKVVNIGTASGIIPSVQSSGSVGTTNQTPPTEATNQTSSTETTNQTPPAGTTNQTPPTETTNSTTQNGFVPIPSANQDFALQNAPIPSGSDLAAFSNQATPNSTNSLVRNNSNNAANSVYQNNFNVPTSSNASATEVPSGLENSTFVASNSSLSSPTSGYASPASNFNSIPAPNFNAATNVPASNVKVGDSSQPTLTNDFPDLNNSGFVAPTSNGSNASVYGTTGQGYSNQSRIASPPVLNRLNIDDGSGNQSRQNSSVPSPEGQGTNATPTNYFVPIATSNYSNGNTPNADGIVSVSSQGNETSVLFQMEVVP